MSLGLQIGASTSKFVGRALNLRSPGDLAGSYAVAGAGGAIAAGAGGVQLQNANGVILQPSGARIGAEAVGCRGRGDHHGCDKKQVRRLESQPLQTSCAVAAWTFSGAELWVGVPGKSLIGSRNDEVHQIDEREE